jgi:hypothetical protein
LMAAYYPPAHAGGWKSLAPIAAPRKELRRDSGEQTGVSTGSSK